MRLEWSKDALADLNRFEDFLRGTRPALAERVAREIAGKAQILADQPLLGRPLAGRREYRQVVLEVLSARYIFHYRYDGTRVVMLRVFHGRESREDLQRTYKLMHGRAHMPCAKKIVLHCPRGYDGRLAALVEAFIGDGVKVIAVVGPECAKIEDIIDEIVVGQGDRAVSLVTSSHPNETVADAVAFAEGLTGELEGEVQVVTL